LPGNLPAAGAQRTAQVNYMSWRNGNWLQTLHQAFGGCPVNKIRVSKSSGSTVKAGPHMQLIEFAGINDGHGETRRLKKSHDPATNVLNANITNGGHSPMALSRWRGHDTGHGNPVAEKIIEPDVSATLRFLLDAMQGRCVL